MAETTRLKGTTAGIGIRFLASLYDAALLFAIEFVAFIPVAIVENSFGIAAPDWARLMLVVTVAYGYFVGFWTRDGATTGMRPWKLKIFNAETGNPITMQEAIIRFLVLFGTWFCITVTMVFVARGQTNDIYFFAVSIVPALSLLCMMLTPHRQPLHDLAAGTNVFRVSDK